MCERYFRVARLDDGDSSRGVKVGDIAMLKYIDSDGDLWLYNPGWWTQDVRFFWPSQLEEATVPHATGTGDPAPKYLYRKASTIMKSMMCHDSCECPRCAAAQDWIASFPV